MTVPVYVVKGIEELLVGNFVPTLGDYVVVATITKIVPLEIHGDNGSNLIPAGFRVTFTDGTFAFYSVGSAIRVGQ